MTRDERVHHYQNLLIVAAIPFAVAFWMNEIKPRFDEYVDIKQECAVYHENGPIGKKCEKKTFRMVDTD